MCRTKFYQSSFFPRTAALWNSLRLRSYSIQGCERVGAGALGRILVNLLRCKYFLFYHCCAINYIPMCSYETKDVYPLAYICSCGAKDVYPLAYIGSCGTKGVYPLAYICSCGTKDVYPLAYICSCGTKDVCPLAYIRVLSKFEIFKCVKTSVYYPRAYSSLTSK